MVRSRISPGLVSAAFVTVVVACLVSVADAGPNWPERGPLRTGEGPAADPPLEWAEGKNVRWKLDVAGLGHGSPIVWGELGSRGLYALDMNGKRLWEKQLGKMQTRNGFGEGASPALHGETLVVTCDHEGPDFVVALDAATSKERWRKDRDEPTTWATPLVITGEGAPQVVVSGTNRVVSYDLATGEERWRAGGLTTNAIPSPVYADGVVYVTSGFRGNALQAIRLNLRGRKHLYRISAD